MENFNTKVKLDIQLSDLDNHDIETGYMDLDWNLEMDIHTYGIVGFAIEVPEQSVTISLNMWGDDEDYQEEIVLDIKNVKIERDSNNSIHNVIPKTLEFFNGKWTLHF